jgi:hypothetical protein
MGGDGIEPPREVRVSSVSYPAKLLRWGAQTEHEDCSGSGPECGRVAIFHVVDPQTMKNRAIVFFGGLAAVVILLGVAFGAASRRNAPPPAEAAPPPS